MMNPNLPLILCFALNPKQSSALRVLCVKFGIQYVSVKEERYGETIGMLCGLDPAGQTEGESGSLNEPMLVFANMKTEQVSAFLGEARRAKFPRPSLMAMLTETNRQWTPLQLQRQLSDERTAMQARMQSIHEQSGHDHVPERNHASDDEEKQQEPNHDA
ncbi:MAG: DUF3783 domain-containing protein [Eubacteriales bacterium]